LYKVSKYTKDMKRINKTPKTLLFLKTNPTPTKIKKFCQNLETQVYTLQQELSNLQLINQALNLELQVYHGNVLPSFDIEFPINTSSHV
jgi:hypothetical protein